MNSIIITILAIALVTATYTDIKSQRIPNWLTFPLMLAGFATHTVFGGWDGLSFAAMGYGFGFVVMAIPYFFGVMGAGDVKLMGAIGAWLGLQATMTAFLFTCIAGGVYAIGMLASDRELLKSVLRNVINTFSIFMATHKFDFSPVDTEKTMPRLCYGVAIAVGTVVAMALHAWTTGSIHTGY